MPVVPSIMGYIFFVGRSILVRNWFWKKTGPKFVGRGSMSLDGPVAIAAWCLWGILLMAVFVGVDDRVAEGDVENR